MNGGKETGASLGRNKTAQFSLTECLSNYLTQWKRSQNITAKYLWNKMYNSAGTWHTAWVPHKGLAIFDLTGAVNGSADGRPELEGETSKQGRRQWWSCRGKRWAPFKQNWDWVQGQGCLSPSTKEMGIWTGCHWKDNLLAMLSLFHNQCKH